MASNLTNEYIKVTNLTSKKVLSVVTVWEVSYDRLLLGVKFFFLFQKTFLIYQKFSNWPKYFEFHTGVTFEKKLSMQDEFGRKKWKMKKWIDYFKNVSRVQKTFFYRFEGSLESVFTIQNYGRGGKLDVGELPCSHFRHLRLHLIYIALDSWCRPFLFIYFFTHSVHLSLL